MKTSLKKLIKNDGEMSVNIEEVDYPLKNGWTLFIDLGTGNNYEDFVSKKIENGGWLLEFIKKMAETVNTWGVPQKGCLYQHLGMGEDFQVIQVIYNIPVKTITIVLEDRTFEE